MNNQELIKKYKTTNVKIPKLPNKNEMLAELVGIVLGDGNIHIVPNNGLYALRIAGNSVKDYDYMTDYIFKLCIELFSIKPRFYKQPKTYCIYVIIQSRIVTDFLLSIGLKEGNKIKSQVTIPQWIWDDDKNLKACIRGLIDTDGCIYEMLPHWPGLFQLNFENRNFTLLNDTRNALIKLGYSPSKICGKRTINGTKFYISKKGEIKKFYKEVGSSNDRNIKQFIKVLNS